MRRALATFVILILSGAPALAGDITTFEGGTSEAVAKLVAPECSDVAYICLLAECHILKATMNVSAIMPDKDKSACPKAVRVFLNDTLLWEFNGTDYGALGMQDRFINGTAEWKSGFGPSGGVNITKIRLPKNAVVRNATMEIGGSGEGFDNFVDFTGAGAGDYLGTSVSDAGDVNNDGYGDVIVGAPYNNTGGDRAGRAYIHFGGAGMDSNADVLLTGVARADFFGTSVSGAGDVNDDGYDDIIVNAPFNDAGGPVAGQAYIFLGGASMDSTADVTFTGAAEDDYFSAAGAGDVNNDGYDDVIGATSHGNAFIFFGGQNMDAIADLNITDISGGVRAAGDLNNDGYDDVIFGASGADGAGKAYIFFGGADMDGTLDVTLTGAADGDRFGASIAGAGDVNKDGYDDVIVGANQNDTGGKDAGRAYIYHGGASMDSTADVLLTGAAANDRFGWSVSGAGDVNKDGYDDVLVGSPYVGAGGANAGRAYIFLGGAGMDSAADVLLTGTAGGDFLGWSVSGAGDVDKDGYDEVIVGVPYNSTGGAYAGSAYVFKSFPGIRRASISMGPISIWNSQSCFNGTILSRDFGPELDQLVRSSGLSGKDKYGNSYVDMPIQAACKGAGNVTLGKLTIVYSLETAILEFSDRLNQYVSVHRADKDSSGNLSIPMRVISGSPGRLKLHDLSIMTDEAPKLVRPLPVVELAEDSAGSGLLDLHEYFGDDYDTLDQLTFSIVSATNHSIVKTEVVGNRFVSADALEGDANDNWTGEVELVLDATDHWGSKSVSNAFKIIVINDNDAPVITSQPPANATGGQEYLYQVVAKDGDNDTLNYGLTKSPENMTVNASTGLVRWVPSKGGRYDVTVTASDKMLTASQEFTITVPNRPPRVTNSTVPIAYVNESYVYIIQAVDDDGDPLTFLLVSKADWMGVDPKTGNITWTPKQVGDFPVSASISDGKDSTMYDFTIKVAQGNRAPGFSSIPVTFAFVSLPYIYDANATDMDGDTLTYLLDTAPAGMTIDNRTGRMAWTPTAAGICMVTIKVVDGKGGEGTQAFMIRAVEYARPNVEFSSPAGSNIVKGKLAVTGRAIKGTQDVVGVQVRVDSGGWMNASGNATWTYTLDTTKLKNGKHALQARAYDGMNYSDIVNRTINVDNAAGKGFIPGFGALLTVLAAVTLLPLGRKCKSKGRK